MKQLSPTNTDGWTPAERGHGKLMLTRWPHSRASWWIVRERVGRIGGFVPVEECPIGWSSKDRELRLKALRAREGQTHGR